MIGKFTGQDTPAVGFSIGFERIVMLLLERGYQVPTSRPKKAYLLEKKISQEKLLEVLEQAKAGPCRRNAGYDHEYEEEQEVPEGTACRTGIYRYYGGVQWLNQCRT